MSCRTTSSGSSIVVSVWCIVSALDHPGQAVGAEQVAVADLGLAQGQVGIDLAAAVERPQQDRALRVGGGLLRGDPAVVHQRLHEGVVVGDLVELAARSR